MQRAGPFRAFRDGLRDGLVAQITGRVSDELVVAFRGAEMVGDTAYSALGFPASAPRSCRIRGLLPGGWLPESDCVHDVSSITSLQHLHVLWRVCGTVGSLPPVTALLRPPDPPGA
jgi:hypothetical protein